jgi:hypothetical protein
MKVLKRWSKIGLQIGISLSLKNKKLSPLFVTIVKGRLLPVDSVVIKLLPESTPA